MLRATITSRIVPVAVSKLSEGLVGFLQEHGLAAVSYAKDDHWHHAIVSDCMVSCARCAAAVS